MVTARVSALRGTGVAELEEAIVERVMRGAPVSEDAFMARRRHVEALKRALAALRPGRDPPDRGQRGRARGRGAPRMRRTRSVRSRERSQRKTYLRTYSPASASGNEGEIPPKDAGLADLLDRRKRTVRCVRTAHRTEGVRKAIERRRHLRCSLRISRHVVIPAVERQPRLHGNTRHGRTQRKIGYRRGSRSPDVFPVCDARCRAHAVGHPTRTSAVRLVWLMYRLMQSSVAGLRRRISQSAFLTSTTGRVRISYVVTSARWASGSSRLRSPGGVAMRRSWRARISLARSTWRRRCRPARA